MIASEKKMPRKPYVKPEVEKVMLSLDEAVLKTPGPEDLDLLFEFED